MQAFVLAAAAVSALGVDVGWQKTDNGEMEYIIQLEPHQVRTLKKGDVIEVGVRPDLRNVRRYRIVVGEDELPQQSAPPKLTIASPAYSAKPLERSGDFSIVVPKDAKGQPLWSEPAVSPGRSSKAIFEEPETYGADTTLSNGVADAADSQPDTTVPPDDAGTLSAAANEDSRYDTIPPVGGAADTVAADETNSSPARFIDPPAFRANPYAPQDSATDQGTASEPPPAITPANQYVPGAAGNRYPPLDDSAYGAARSDVGAPAVSNATNSATVVDPQLGTRYSNAAKSTYSAPPYAGSASFQQPGEASTPPPRTLVTEMPGADPTRVAAAFAPANTKPGLQSESTPPPKKIDAETSDGQSSVGDSPKPWALFTLTLFALFASLGGNLYLGWMNWDMRQRFRSLIRRMKLGDSKSRATNDELD